MLNGILVFLAIAFTGLYILHKRTNDYWKRFNVTHVKALPIVGNMLNVLIVKQNIGGILWDMYKTPEFEKEPVVGFHAVGRPALLLRDPDLIKRVMIKDFNSFSDRFIKTDPHHDPVGNYNLFFIRNPEWKELRTKISPVFTSGKIKQIYPLMQEVGKDLEAFLEKSPKDSIVEIKMLCARFTTDLIATVAFGIKSNSIANANSEFFQQCRNVFRLTLWRGLEIVSFLMIPNFTKIFHFAVFSKDTLKFLRGSVKHIMSERERTGTIRNDLIDTLIDMKRRALQTPEKPNLALDFDYLVAQAAVFQTAGYETSSAAMTFTSFELARNPHMQDRLRAEIRKATEEGDGDISYNTIQEMPYLGMVVEEVLRMYPSLAFLERECTPEAGGYSLQPYADYNVPAGMPVYISIIGMGRDPKYWSNPNEFDPERFSPENRSKINKDAYLPFGTGPHNCIGMRLGLLQAKLGLVHLLKNYRVCPCEKTPKYISFDPLSFNMANKGGIYLKLERVEG